jgi:hypothetical protein
MNNLLYCTPLTEEISISGPKGPKKIMGGCFLPPVLSWKHINLFIIELYHKVRLSKDLNHFELPGGGTNKYSFSLGVLCFGGWEQEINMNVTDALKNIIRLQRH